MSVKYKILFVVELLNHYYADKQSRDFEIVPSKQTLIAMRNQAMLHKVLGNKLVVLVKVKSTAPDLDEPFIDLNVDDHFTFYLKVSNPNFLNVTNISYIPSQQQRFYFSNINQNQESSVLHLTKEIAEYNPAHNYAVASFAATNTGQVFEAIKSSSNANQHGLEDALYWQSRGNNQYVTNNDLVEVSPALYHINTLAATNFTIQVFKVNTTSGMYDVQVGETEEQTFSTPQTKIAISLNKLPAGRYRIQVNSNSTDVYVDSDVLYNNVFGILEVFNHLPADNSFALLNNGGGLHENTFTICFANRFVIWKYRARTTDITAVHDAVYTFTSVAPKQFISTEPVPLTEKPLNTVSIHSPVFGNITSVANPLRDRISLIEKDGDTYYCAEKFLNY